VEKGTHTVGVRRQYTGTAGRVENAQVAVYLVYASPAGHAGIYRELYVAKSWMTDPDRCRAAGIPDHVRFATKPALAAAMLARTLDAGVPAAWVTGGEVYGANPRLRAELETRGVGYVLAVAYDHRVPTGAGPPWPCSPTPSSPSPRPPNAPTVRVDRADLQRDPAPLPRPGPQSHTRRRPPDALVSLATPAAGTRPRLPLPATSHPTTMNITNYGWSTRTLRALVTRRALFRGRRAARVQKVVPAGATLPSRLVFGQRMSLSVSGWSSLSVGSRRIQLAWAVR
jgi:hypothetical protein